MSLNGHINKKLIEGVIIKTICNVRESSPNFKILECKIQILLNLRGVFYNLSNSLGKKKLNFLFIKLGRGDRRVTKKKPIIYIKHKLVESG